MRKTTFTLQQLYFTSADVTRVIYTGFFFVFTLLFIELLYTSALSKSNSERVDCVL